jgi:hypothetical protein
LEPIRCEGSFPLALYRVHFKWKEKEVQLQARSLDLTHPYFVSIKDLVFPTGKKLIINPSEDDVRRAFGEANHLMIPFQSVILIEELADEPAQPRVMRFGVVQGDDGREDEESKQEERESEAEKTARRDETPAERDEEP